MPAPRFVLAIDQGTTSSRAILFDATGTPRTVAQKELSQSFPQPGWVEHDADEIWQDTLQVCHRTLEQAGVSAAQLDCIGITNQRETTVVWDRASGDPVHPAIVWQDRRTADRCRQLHQQGLGPTLQEKTGLLLDPYFSATKLEWILSQVSGARTRAAKGELAFGTVESYLLWKLTGGKTHATDASNAARTMLFNIQQQCWDKELLELFDIPAQILPEVRDNSSDFGHTETEHFGTPVPITGMAGDQQAATFGQACFTPGMMKSTYGTGCFVLLNTGSKAVTSGNRLLSTVAYRLNSKTTYALEGSVFNAGTTIQWLRDGMKFFADAKETLQLAEQADPRKRIYLVPAFTGLGAPYWDPDARGAVFGLTRDTSVADLVRAGLEAVCHQTRDLLEAMAADGATAPTALRVDGGMVANDWVLQFLADILGLPVERPAVTETTALGAAFLAGLHTGYFGSQQSIAAQWRCQQRFEPNMPVDEREDRYQGWLSAVQRIRTQQH